MAEAFLRSVEGFTQSLGKERRTRRSVAQIQSIGYSIDFPAATPILDVVATMNGLRDRLKAEPYLDPPNTLAAYQLDPITLAQTQLFGLTPIGSLLGGSASTIQTGLTSGPNAINRATMSKVRCTFGRTFFLDVGIPLYYLESGISRPVCVYDESVRSYNSFGNPNGTLIASACFDPASGDYINPPPGAVVGRFVVSSGQVEYLSPIFDAAWADPLSPFAYVGLARRNWFANTTPLDVTPEFAFPVLAALPPACCDLSPI